MDGTPALLASNSHAEHDLRELRALLVSEDVNEVAINSDGAVWSSAPTPST
jgi:type IV secretion system protein VirB11